jgi:hypothetical protein
MDALLSFPWLLEFLKAIPGVLGAVLVYEALRSSSRIIRDWRDRRNPRRQIYRDAEDLANAFKELASTHPEFLEADALAALENILGDLEEIKNKNKSRLTTSLFSRSDVH